MADRLSALLTHFELRSRVFFSGFHCGVAAFTAEPGVGHLHLLRSGALQVRDADGAARIIDQPSLLLYGQPIAHRLEAPFAEGADLVCAAIEFGIAHGNPLLGGLPSPFVVPLSMLPQQGRLLDLLFDEAFGAHCGQQAAVNRLIEVLLIHVLRHGMKTGVVAAGALAGLADPRLSKALIALHETPGKGWSLDTLAAQAGMSRARFAAHFHQIVGVTPGEYLTAWRMSIALGLLRRGRPVGVVASMVGYGATAAFSRAFLHNLGMSPRAWLRAQHAA